MVNDFRIISAEKNKKKGDDYEAKSLIYSFEELGAEKGYIDLFDDFTAYKKDGNNERLYFFQAKNYAKFYVNDLKKALVTLFYNYNIGLKEIDSVENYTVFARKFSPKKYEKFIIENTLISLDLLDDKDKQRIIEHFKKNEYIKHVINLDKKVTDFLKIATIYICSKENHEYIKLTENKILNKDFRNGIFSEICDYVTVVKKYEIGDEKLTRNGFISKYNEKKITKKQYYALLYKRVIGSNLIDDTSIQGIPRQAPRWLDLAELKELSEVESIVYKNEMLRILVEKRGLLNDIIEYILEYGKSTTEIVKYALLRKKS